MSQASRPLAVVTGASSGIGFELARVALEHGHDILIAANEPAIETAAARLRGHGGEVEAVQADLSTVAGIDALVARVHGRPVAALLANAGAGVRGGFLDQDFADSRHVVDTNVVGTIDLIHRIGRDMRNRRAGRILITGSIAGLAPGAFHAVYNASKAFIDSFSFALRAELKDSGVTVTVLMPGATDTDFFERADLEDTKLAHAPKDDPAEVARQGWKAMAAGDGDVIPGWHNKLQAAIMKIAPPGLMAAVHGKVAEPGSAEARR